MDKLPTKIVICSVAHFHDDSRIFHRQALTLSEKYQVNLYICAPFREKQINKNLKIIGLPVWKRKTQRIKNHLLLWSYLKNENGSVYIFHEPELLLTLPFVKIFKKGKIIYDIHEFYHKHFEDITWLPRTISVMVARLYQLLERMALRYADMLWYPVDKIIEYHPNYTNNHRIHKLPVKNYPILKLSTPANSNQTMKADRFIYVGVLTEDRKFETLIKAFHLFSESFPQYELLIAGPFYSEVYKQKIESLIRKLSLTDRVKLPGRVSYQETFMLMNQSKVGMLVLPPLFNFENSLPNKLFEYMAAGLPVIASNFPNFIRVVESAKCGICIDSQNEVAIAEAMKQIVLDEGRREAMGENGRRAVQQVYNWEKQGEEMLKSVARLMAAE